MHLDVSEIKDWGINIDEKSTMEAIFRRRSEIECAIYDAIHLRAKRMIELTPDELKDWISGEFRNPDMLTEFILREQKCLEFGRSIQIFTKSDGCPYGVADAADAERKFDLLKKAWQGIMDVEFINDPNQGMRIILKFQATKRRLSQQPK